MTIHVDQQQRSQHDGCVASLVLMANITEASVQQVFDDVSV